MFIKIDKNPDGSHAFQIGGVLEDGWAFVSDELERPNTFPYVDIVTETVTYPATDDHEEYSRLEVISMTDGEVIPVEEPDTGLTQEERITALEEENEMLKECLLEMSAIVYA